MRRNNTDIMIELLDIAENGSSKTNLVYKANLNFKIIKPYLKTCKIMMWIEKRGKIYYTTDRGKDFAKKYKDLMRSAQIGSEINNVPKLYELT